MADTRKANINWNLQTNGNGTTPVDAAQLAVLMDLRDELQKLNRLLHCRNFIEIPLILRAIRRNTIKRKRGKKS